MYERLSSVHIVECWVGDVVRHDPSISELGDRPPDILGFSGDGERTAYTRRYDEGLGNCDDRSS